MSCPALLLTARSGSRPSGSGSVGKKVFIRTFAFASSVTYLWPYATSSGTSIGTPEGLA
jgi:hypothetical protein